MTDLEGGGLEIISKANAVLSFLESSGERTVNEIAQSIEAPVSSTYRLLSSLIGIGWVDAGSRRGVYRLGLHFLRIGGMVEDRIDIRSVAWPSLLALHDALGASAFLCVPRGHRAVCIERIEGGDVRSIAMRIGDSQPLNRGAAATAILAFLPEVERSAILDEVGLGLSGTADRTAIERQLLETRTTGYSLVDGEVTPGVAALGAPVWNHRGEVEGSITVSGLSQQIVGRRATAIRLILDAARAVSIALGWEDR
jgi:Transcriptional regulator